MPKLTLIKGLWILENMSGGVGGGQCFDGFVQSIIKEKHIFIIPSYLKQHATTWALDLICLCICVICLKQHWTCNLE